MTSIEFDVQSLLDYLGGDSEFAAQLVDIFFADAATALDGIKSCATVGDSKGLYEHLHALKGGAANIRAKALHDFLQQLSESVLNNSCDVEELITRLDSEYQKAVEALSCWQKTVK